MPNNLNDDGFKAKPFPKAIFTDYAYEQIEENHRYRNIRKALRQKALLSNSKLPPRMQKEQEINSFVNILAPFTLLAFNNILFIFRVKK